MRQVEIKKADLKTIVERNLHDYQGKLSEARALFGQAVAVELKRAQEAADRGHMVAVNIQPPSDQSEQLKRVLRMLELEVNPTVTLSQAEYSQYVDGDFDAIRQLDMLNVGYHTSLQGR